MNRLNCIQHPSCLTLYLVRNMAAHMVETSTLKAVLSFCPLPLSSGVSFGFFFSLLLGHATVSPSGYTNARSRGDKGTDVFFGASVHHVVSASIHNTGGYGQLMVNYYISSLPLPFPLFFFFVFFFRLLSQSSCLLLNVLNGYPWPFFLCVL